MLMRFVKILCGILVAAAVATGAARAAEHGGSPAAGPGKSIQVRLDPLVVSIMRNGTVEKHIGFVIVLEVADSAAQAKLQEQMPKLNNAFVVDINALASLPGAPDNGIDQEQLKRRVAASCVRVLGPNTVKNITFLRSFTRKVT